MRIALIADSFPPMRTSAAVQLRDLANGFVQRGHKLTVILPGRSQVEPWIREYVQGVEVVRLRALQTKNVSYVRRTLAEFAMPHLMLWNIKKSPLAGRGWDGIIWYSPSIFHGPLVSFLKRSSGCKSYLIIRDIFPEWAVDMGLMGRGLPYLFFKAVARYQYAVADTIGVQSSGNKVYFERWQRVRRGRRLEELKNWLGKQSNLRCSIRIEETRLAGRKVFVYAGNMGVAQGLDKLLELATVLSGRRDIGFLFVGRGSEATRLKLLAEKRHLNNVIFFDEIDPDEIPDLYAQCHVGVVALDPRHKTHNIPGKFLTYMQSGLPVLATINRGNDLASIIRDNQVGEVCDSDKLEELRQKAEKLMEFIGIDKGISARCKALFESQFASDIAVKQIISAL